MATPPKHSWSFARRFRRNAFGWRSKIPVKAVREAVSEIKKTAKKDPVLAAEGAVLFLEKVSPALAQVDIDILMALRAAIEAAGVVGETEETVRKIRELMSLESSTDEFTKEVLKKAVRG